VSDGDGFLLSVTHHKTQNKSDSTLGNHAVPSAPGSSVADLLPGAVVAYTMKPGASEEEAQVVEVSSSQGRRDNILIRFVDGRERNTSEAKLRIIRPAEPQQQQQEYHDQPPLDGTRHNMTPTASPYKPPIASPSAVPQQQQQQQQYSPSEIQNIPPSPERHSGGFGDTGRSSIRLHSSAGGQNSMGTSFGWGDAEENQRHHKEAHQLEGRNNQQQQMHQPSPFGGPSAGAVQAGSPPRMAPGTPGRRSEFQENRIGSQVLTVVKGSAAGELALGQKVHYKQTPRSEEAECTIVDIELPSTNGAMRTKTYYKVEFEDGRTRQTTRDKLSVPK